MRGEWGEKDIEAGTMVASPTENGKFRCPCIIGYFSYGPGEGNIYGLTDMRDGMFMKFGNGSKLDLAKQLTKSGYVPVNKAIFKDGLKDILAVENRLGLPVVTITNSSCGR